MTALGLRASFFDERCNELDSMMQDRIAIAGKSSFLILLSLVAVHASCLGCASPNLPTEDSVSRQTEPQVESLVGNPKVGGNPLIDAGVEYRSVDDARFPVNVRGGWGFIERTGRIVISPKYRLVRDFSEGRAPFLKGGDFERRRRPDGELEWFPKDGLWGFLAPDGREVIAPRFEDVGAFHGGFAPAKSNGAWGYVDPLGTLAVPSNYAQVGGFSGGLGPVSVDTGKKDEWGHPLVRWGYVDGNGKNIITPQFEFAGQFEGEAAAALLPLADESGKSKAMNEQWVLIDRRGRTIGKTVYAYLEAIGEGKFSANVAGESFLRILDVSGRTLFTVKPGTKADGAFCLWANRGCHTEVGRFVDGMASYRSGADLVHEFTDDMATHGYYDMGGRWGVIDDRGRVFIPPTYRYLGPLSEGTLVVESCIGSGDVLVECEGGAIEVGCRSRRPTT